MDDFSATGPTPVPLPPSADAVDTNAAIAQAAAGELGTVPWDQPAEAADDHGPAGGAIEALLQPNGLNLAPDAVASLAARANADGTTEQTLRLAPGAAAPLTSEDGTSAALSALMIRRDRDGAIVAMVGRADDPRTSLEARLTEPGLAAARRLLGEGLTATDAFVQAVGLPGGASQYSVTTQIDTFRLGFGQAGDAG